MIECNIGQEGEYANGHQNSNIPVPSWDGGEIYQNEEKSPKRAFRETLGGYDADWEWGKIYRYGETKAKQEGITEDQVEDMIDARRR